MITVADYNYPLGLPGGYFNGRIIPPFSDYSMDYHIHFMRYLYFTCIMDASGDYPIEIGMEEIQRAFDECKKNNCRNCKPRIKKILVGEAPPPKPDNYFYNPFFAGTYAWTGAIKSALFPGAIFPKKIDFLIACAKEGFVLLDLFPYPITYDKTNTKRYRDACINAFGTGPMPYPFNLLTSLGILECCIQANVTFGFGLIRVGKPILSAPASVAAFNAWLLRKHEKLNPAGPLDIMRPVAVPVKGASNFLRVCGRQGIFGPNPVLLKVAGF